MPNAVTDGHHITSPPVLRVHRTQYVIEERAFVELGVFDVGVKREELARHFDHVVDVARLSSAPVYPVAQLVGRAKVFILAVAAGSEGVMIDQRVPEELRRLAVNLIARISV